MKLSIVTTMYNSAPYIEEFYAKFSRAAEKITPDYEIIFVNDGSPDASLDNALCLYDKKAKVKVIDLSKNFGQHKALMTGLAFAEGDLVFITDCDLEEDADLLIQFYEIYQKNPKSDVIYGIQKHRKGGIFERISGGAFYRLINFLSPEHIPANHVTARLMSQRYVANLIRHKDKEVFIAGLWSITGFEQTPVPVNKKSKGTSSYSLSKKIGLLVNSITSFSNKPLVYIFYLGSVVTVLAFGAAFYLIINRIFFNVMLSGWPSLIVSIWLLGGLTIFCLGIIGIYLSKIFSETKDRPYTIIRNIYQHTNNSGEKNNERIG